MLQLTSAYVIPGPETFFELNDQRVGRGVWNIQGLNLQLIAIGDFEHFRIKSEDQIRVHIGS